MSKPYESAKTLSRVKPLNAQGIEAKWTDQPQEPIDPSDEESFQPEGAEYWIHRAQTNYQSGLDYMESAFHGKWNKALANFRGKHPSGSKYHSDYYKHRAQGFRPKTRSIIKRQLAACNHAFFSTDDVVTISPRNDGSDEAHAGAELWQQILNLRLKIDVPWFQVCLGAYQDCLVNGLCAAMVEWEYLEDEEGEVLSDKPVIELIPPENVMISPSASWINQGISSPYVIRKMTMTVAEARLRMMQDADSATAAQWYYADKKQFFEAIHGFENQNSAQTARSNQQQHHEVDDNEVVEILQHFERIDGIEYVYETLSDMHLLSVPEPVNERWLHLRRDERPLIIGVAEIETHTPLPDSLASQIAPLQSESNDIANQRRDNVRLAMNKQYMIRQGANLDVRGFMMSRPGGVHRTQDPDRDVRVLETNDVTGSSFHEQDRIDNAIDELSGTFSTGSVQSNRALNETVGGMELLSGDANTVTEFQIKVFAMTFIEPVLRQFLKLEQRFETDVMLTAMAASEADLQGRFGLSEVSDHLLRHDVTLDVDVGVDATNPMRAVERLLFAVKTANDLGSVVDGEEVTKVVFGKLGWSNGERFLADQEQQGEQAPDPAMLKLQLEQQKLQLEQMKLEANNQLEQQKLMMDRELKLLELELRHTQSEKGIMANLQQAKMQDQTRRDVAAAHTLSRDNEMKLKRETGAGI